MTALGASVEEGESVLAQERWQSGKGPRHNARTTNHKANALSEQDCRSDSANVNSLHTMYESNTPGSPPLSSSNQYLPFSGSTEGVT